MRDSPGDHARPVGSNPARGPAEKGTMAQTANAPESRRWFRVGRSNESDARTAGTEAASLAIGGEAAALLVVFCSDSYDLRELLDAINRVSGGVPLIGCSTAGEIATNGPGDAGVVITAVGGDGFAVATAGVASRGVGLREASAEAASCISLVEERPHRVLMLLSDGLAGDQQEVVRGAYSVVGASVPLVGGCAGDDLKMNRTFQLHGDRVLEDAVVAAAIGSDAPMGIGVQHGWRRVGDAMLVTSS